MPFCVKENALDKDISVAKISYAYDNADLLSILDKRGNAIMNGKLKDLDGLNKKLKALQEGDPNAESSLKARN